MSDLGAGRDWRRAAVYGLGVSGRAAARLLRARGVEVVGVDARAPEALELDELAADPGFALVAGGDPPALPARPPVSTPWCSAPACLPTGRCSPTPAAAACR